MALAGKHKEFSSYYKRQNDSAIVGQRRARGVVNLQNIEDDSEKYNFSSITKSGLIVIDLEKLGFSLEKRDKLLLKNMVAAIKKRENRGNLTGFMTEWHILVRRIDESYPKPKPYRKTTSQLG